MALAAISLPFVQCPPSSLRLSLPSKVGAPLGALERIDDAASGRKGDSVLDRILLWRELTMQLGRSNKFAAFITTG